MDNPAEDFDRTSSGRRVSLISRLALWIAATVVVLVLFILGFLSPIDKLHKMNERYLSMPAGDGWNWKTWSSPRIPREAALVSLLLLSESDSLSLHIDLADSTLKLVLSGVVVHRAPIREWKASRFFSKLEHRSAMNFFSVPHPSRYVCATFDKVPSTVRYAPSDTAEASSSIPPLPDTALPAYVFFSMMTGDHIRIDIRQHERSGNRISFLTSRAGIWCRRSCGLLAELLRFRIPEYSPWIILEADADDVLTIYRALPMQPLVVIPYESGGREEKAEDHRGIPQRVN